MKRTFWYAALLISLGYLALHLFSLTAFPVFADEAIYIRWAQLIRDDWHRYLLFPLNDGKTPLFMWLVAITQGLTRDQLFSARLVSVTVGLVQLWVSGGIVRVLGGRPKAQLLAMLLTAVLPFWFFHHHLALIDGMLGLWASICALSILRYVREPSAGWLIGIALSWGLALLTKVPAIVLLPGLALLMLSSRESLHNTVLRHVVPVGLSFTLGSLLFLVLKLHPAFRQLFSRGNDFLFPVADVLSGGWVQTIQNTPAYIQYFWQYLTPSVFVLLVIGLFAKRHQRQIHILFWAGISFVVPIALLGKLVFARYLFPAVVFFTPAAALAMESLVDGIGRAVPLYKKLIGGVLVGVLLANTLTQSLFFDWAVVHAPNTVPFVSSDRQQYLLEWSSGHGIVEVLALMRDATQTGTLAVATEGTFGTLPDALLMYMHERDVSKLYVEGIGLPVNGLPQQFTDRAAQFDRTWLVVNSYRMGITLPAEKLVEQFCRPVPTAPCLQVWDVTDLVHGE